MVLNVQFHINQFFVFIFSVFLSQDKVSEKDVDPHLKQLFKQLAGNVG